MGGPEPVQVGQSERINALMAGQEFGSYLEIGVHRGLTLTSVSAQRCVGVDPRPLLSPSDTPAHVEVHAVTSDAFFAALDPATRFDFVFIDGLHEYNQALRDLLWSLAFCHERTVIMLDDTRPWDFASSLPPSSDPQAVKAFLRVQHTAWMGDVYKTLAFVHDFLPQYSFATFGEPHAQTVLWRQPRGEFSPLFGSLQAIDRLDFADFIRLQDSLYRVEADEPIIERVRAAIATA